MSTNPHSQPQPVFIDNQNNILYYLGFDLILAAAPIRDGIAYIEEGASIKFPTDFNHLVEDARHAAIRQALLEEWSNDNLRLEASVSEARSLTARLTAEAKLSDASEVTPSNGKIMSIILDGPQINLQQ